MTNRVHRPLKVITFNANGIGRQSLEVSKQLQDSHIDVVLFSETYLKSHERFYNRNYYFYRTDRHPEIKGGTAVAVRNGVPHMHVDLPLLVPVEATGVCIPIDNKKVLLAAAYRSSWRTWTDSDITKLLSLKDKFILVGDLNSKHPSWNSVISNPSGEKLLRFF
jgi:exonuclease III